MTEAHFRGDVVLYLFTISCDQRIKMHMCLLECKKNMLYGSDTKPCIANKNENKYVDIGWVCGIISIFQ